VQVEPTEVVLKPGDAIQLHARLYDAAGRFLREQNSETWLLQGLKGRVIEGKFEVEHDKVGQAGLIKAKVGSLTGEARARHPAAALERDIRLTRSAACRRMGERHHGAIPGERTGWPEGAQKLPDETLFKRMRVLWDWRTGRITPSRPTSAFPKTAPNGRRRRDRAALHACGVR
jgi:hypothetical protein